MFDLYDLFVWSAIAFFLVLFWRGLGAREAALGAAQRHCEKLDVQWLDGNVALQSIWFKRDGQGRLCLRRIYLFEFSSTGERRYAGSVVMLGRRVQSVQLEPHIWQ